MPQEFLSSICYNHLSKSWYEKFVLPECYARLYSIKNEIINHIAREPSRIINPDILNKISFKYASYIYRNGFFMEPKRRNLGRENKLAIQVKGLECDP